MHTNFTCGALYSEICLQKNKTLCADYSLMKVSGFSWQPYLGCKCVTVTCYIVIIRIQTVDNFLILHNSTSYKYIND